MKTQRIMQLLICFIFAVSSVVLTEQLLAQSCAPINKCGNVIPGCYDPPKVGMPGQKSYLTPDYCATSTGGGKICAPGVFLCISTTIPDSLSGCSCSGANNCLYVNIRNILSADGDNPALNISKVEVKLKKDSSSSKWTICSPQKQWGWSPWTSLWRIMIGAQTFNSGQCNAQTNWGVDLEKLITLRPPLSGSDDDPNYYIEFLQHLTFVVCGATEIELKIHYLDLASSPNSAGDSGWLTGLTINNVQCPDSSGPNGWCNWVP